MLSGVTVTMLPRTVLFGATLLSISLGIPRAARASDVYARLLAAPAYFHNDHDFDFYDSSGFGVASQLDLGARLRKSLALHASLVADTSQWIRFDSEDFRGEYETTVLGLGLGATTTIDQFSLGAVLGAQFTWHPGDSDAHEGPDAAGVGPLFSVTAGYLFPRLSEDVEVGVHALARYRVGKDEEDPSGYQLGLGVSIGIPDEDSKSEEPGEPAPEPRPEPSVGYASAHIGWWNAELEFLFGPGLYVAAGGPWVGALLGPLEERVYIPFGARVGYQFDASEEWKLRVATHLVGLSEVYEECSVDCGGPISTQSWQLFEIGARHESPSGLVYGIDVPFFVINDVLGLDRSTSPEDEPFAPPISIIFTQVYVGYAWAI